MEVVTMLLDTLSAGRGSMSITRHRQVARPCSPGVWAVSRGRDEPDGSVDAAFECAEVFGQVGQTDVHDDS